MTEVRVIQTSTHGRYLLRQPVRSGPAPLLVGFHGYAETAETQLDRLVSIPGSDRWLLVSIQGLHRFYRGRTEEIASSWMTRQDRELAIADNKAYVASVVESVAKECDVTRQWVFAGFSQGVAMALRAACHLANPANRANAQLSIIALGGNVPPELHRDELAGVRAALFGRGERDVWYSSALLTADSARLRDAGVQLETLTFDAEHEWTADFSRTAGTFLDSQNLRG